MKKNHWIKGVDFTEKYELGRNNIHAINSHKKPKWITKYVPMNCTRKELLINEGYLIRVADFRTALYMEAHELYYIGIELFGSSYQMAMFIAKGDVGQRNSWNDWFANSLFTPKDSKFSLLDTRVSKRIVKFVRVARRFKNDDVHMIKQSGRGNHNVVEIQQFSKEDGTYIATFKSIAEASRATRESASHISLATRGLEGSKNPRYLWARG